MLASPQAQTGLGKGRGSSCHPDIRGSYGATLAEGDQEGAWVPVGATPRVGAGRRVSAGVLDCTSRVFRTRTFVKEKENQSTSSPKKENANDEIAMLHGVSAPALLPSWPQSSGGMCYGLVRRNDHPRAWPLHPPKRGQRQEPVDSPACPRDASSLLSAVTG